MAGLQRQWRRLLSPFFIIHTPGQFSARTACVGHAGNSSSSFFDKGAFLPSVYGGSSCTAEPHQAASSNLFSIFLVVEERGSSRLVDRAARPFFSHCIAAATKIYGGARFTDHVGVAGQYIKTRRARSHPRQARAKLVAICRPQDITTAFCAMPLLPIGGAMAAPSSAVCRWRGDIFVTQ
jgi:hypothetical protein